MWYRNLSQCLLSSIGSAYTFWIYMVMAILAFFFVLKLIPETKGKSLEEIEKYWMHAEDKSSSVDLKKQIQH